MVRQADAALFYLHLMKDMRKSGTEIPQLDKDFIHMVSSGMFSAMFEIVVHDMEKSVAIERVKKLKMFYTGGWEKLFGISF